MTALPHPALLSLDVWCRALLTVVPIGLVHESASSQASAPAISLPSCSACVTDDAVLREFLGHLSTTIQEEEGAHRQVCSCVSESAVGANCSGLARESHDASETSESSKPPAPLVFAIRVADVASSPAATAYESLLPYCRAGVVLGVVNGSALSSPDLATLSSQWAALVHAHFYNPFASLVFVIGAEDWVVADAFRNHSSTFSNAFRFVPSSASVGASTVVAYLKAEMRSVAVSAAAAAAATVRRLRSWGGSKGSHNALPTPRTCLDVSVQGRNSSLKSHPFRIAKYVGDTEILLGRYSAARESYRHALVGLATSSHAGDFLWAASAEEGLAALLLLQSIPVRAPLWYGDTVDRSSASRLSCPRTGTPGARLLADATHALVDVVSPATSIASGSSLHASSNLASSPAHSRADRGHGDGTSFFSGEGLASLLDHLSAALKKYEAAYSTVGPSSSKGLGAEYPLVGALLRLSLVYRAVGRPCTCSLCDLCGCPLETCVETDKSLPVPTDAKDSRDFTPSAGCIWHPFSWHRALCYANHISADLHKTPNHFSNETPATQMARRPRRGWLSRSSAFPRRNPILCCTSGYGSSIGKKLMRAISVCAGIGSHLGRGLVARLIGDVSFTCQRPRIAALAYYVAARAEVESTAMLRLAAFSRERRAFAAKILPAMASMKLSRSGLVILSRIRGLTAVVLLLAIAVSMRGTVVLASGLLDVICQCVPNICFMVSPCLCPFFTTSTKMSQSAASLLVLPKDRLRRGSCPGAHEKYATAVTADANSIDLESLGTIWCSQGVDFRPIMLAKHFGQSIHNAPTASVSLPSPISSSFMNVLLTSLSVALGLSVGLTRAQDTSDRLARTDSVIIPRYVRSVVLSPLRAVGQEDLAFDTAAPCPEIPHQRSFGLASAMDTLSVASGGESYSVVPSVAPSRRSSTAESVRSHYSGQSYTKHGASSWISTTSGTEERSVDRRTFGANSAKAHDQTPAPNLDEITRLVLHNVQSLPWVDLIIAMMAHPLCFKSISSQSAEGPTLGAHNPVVVAEMTCATLLQALSNAHYAVQECFPLVISHISLIFGEVIDSLCHSTHASLTQRHQSQLRHIMAQFCKTLFTVRGMESRITDKLEQTVLELGLFEPFSDRNALQAGVAIRTGPDMTDEEPQSDQYRVPTEWLYCVMLSLQSDQVQPQKNLSERHLSDTLSSSSMVPWGNLISHAFVRPISTTATAQCLFVATPSVADPMLLKTACAVAQAQFTTDPCTLCLAYAGICDAFYQQAGAQDSASRGGRCNGHELLASQQLCDWAHYHPHIPLLCCPDEYSRAFEGFSVRPHEGSSEGDNLKSLFLINPYPRAILNGLRLVSRHLPVVGENDDFEVVVVINNPFPFHLEIANVTVEFTRICSAVSADFSPYDLQCSRHDSAEPHAADPSEHCIISSQADMWLRAGDRVSVGVVGSLATNGVYHISGISFHLVGVPTRAIVKRTFGHHEVLPLRVVRALPLLESESVTALNAVNRLIDLESDEGLAAQLPLSASLRELSMLSALGIHQISFALRNTSSCIITSLKIDIFGIGCHAHHTADGAIATGCKHAVPFPTTFTVLNRSDVEAALPLDPGKTVLVILAVIPSILQFGSICAFPRRKPSRSASRSASVRGSRRSSRASSVGSATLERLQPKVNTLCPSMVAAQLPCGVVVFEYSALRREATHIRQRIDKKGDSSVTDPPSLDPAVSLESRLGPDALTRVDVCKSLTSLLRYSMPEWAVEPTRKLAIGLPLKMTNVMRNRPTLGNKNAFLENQVAIDAVVIETHCCDARTLRGHCSCAASYSTTENCPVSVVTTCDPNMVLCAYCVCATLPGDCSASSPPPEKESRSHLANGFMSVSSMAVTASVDCACMTVCEKFIFSLLGCRRGSQVSAAAAPKEQHSPISEFVEIDNVPVTVSRSTERKWVALPARWRSVSSPSRGVVVTVLEPIAQADNSAAHGASSAFVAILAPCTAFITTPHCPADAPINEPPPSSGTGCPFVPVAYDSAQVHSTVHRFAELYLHSLTDDGTSQFSKSTTIHATV